jgi:hypothetical protein
MGSLLGTLPSDGLVWRLQGATPKPVDGHVTPGSGGSWLVHVVQNCESVLTESYPDAASALTRAGQLRDGLVAKGWLQVPIRADS